MIGFIMQKNKAVLQMDTDPDQSNKYLVEKKKLSKKSQSRYKYGSNLKGPKDNTSNSSFILNQTLKGLTGSMKKRANIYKMEYMYIVENIFNDESKETSLVFMDLKSKQ
jgi:hypothetical protein